MITLPALCVDQRRCDLAEQSFDDSGELGPHLDPNRTLHSSQEYGAHEIFGMPCDFVRHRRTQYPAEFYAEP
jgi:hypothetical protein